MGSKKKYVISQSRTENIRPFLAVLMKVNPFGIGLSYNIKSAQACRSVCGLWTLKAMFHRGRQQRLGRKLSNCETEQVSQSRRASVSSCVKWGQG